MRNLKYTWIGFLLLVLGSFASAAPLNLSSAPLSVSSNALPNIMLLLDNSGSMNALIEEDGYPGPDNNVQQWEAVAWNGNNLYWDPIDKVRDYTRLTSIYGVSTGNVSCSNNNGWRTFKRVGSSVHYCVRLPLGQSDDGSNAIGNGSLYANGYLTYLLNTYVTGGPQVIDLTAASFGLPKNYRMNVAKAVAKQLIEQTNQSGIQTARIGLSSFRSNSEGAVINAECGTANADLYSAIDNLSASTATPLGEALYEITRYYRGMSSYYGSGNYTSPLQYRCQKNFAIVITDGFPTLDNNFPNNDPHDPDHSLPDWDDLHPNTNASDYPDFPEFSDGFDPTSTSGSLEGTSLYLDDIAKFANDIDFKSGNETDDDGKSYDDAGFVQQNMNTYVVGFAVDNTMLKNAAHYGTGQYFQANNAEQLLEALGNAVQDIISRSAGAGSAASSSGSIQEGTLIYQTRFNSGDWSGQLLAFDVAEDGSLDADEDAADLGAKWDAAEKLTSASQRKIYTRVKNTEEPEGSYDYSGVSFEFENIPNEFYSLTEQQVDYIRGESVEGARNRSSLLGDIVNSTPKYVGPPDASHDDDDYATFLYEHRNRDAMIYVGANDGMLHAFNAADGNEEFAFIPSLESFDDKFDDFMDTSYSHTYFVDGSPTVLDAKVNGSWKTVLVGGLNYGGKSIYALDVTTPTASSADMFMWEFSHDDLGFTFSQPLIVKMNDGEWYVVFGSGYNPDNEDGDGRIFVVDIHDGSLVATLTTETGAAEDPKGQSRPNGIAKIAPVDLNNDGMVDYIYTGDLFGNVWKFKTTSSNKTQWDLDYKLYSSCSDDACAADDIQPITTQPIVKVHSSGKGVMVYFGTGKYLEVTDNNGANGGVQSIYGIHDIGVAPTSGNQPAVSGRSELTEQTIDFEGGVTYSNDTESTTYTMRVISNNEASATSRGWYLDLISPVYGSQGERLITDMVLRRGYLYFYTSIPEADTCNPTGDSWLFVLNAETGTSPTSEQFKMDECQGTSCEVECSGNDCPANPSVCKNNCSNDDGGGGASKPVILPNRYSQTEDDCGDAELYSGSSTSSVTVDCGAGLGRQSWRQYFQ
jgi:type IV pilus assembly protein PilY1